MAFLPNAGQMFQRSGLSQAEQILRAANIRRELDERKRQTMMQLAEQAFQLREAKKAEKKAKNRQRNIAIGAGVGAIAAPFALASLGAGSAPLAGAGAGFEIGSSTGFIGSLTLEEALLASGLGSGLGGGIGGAF